jgi:hypothetical protein
VAPSFDELADALIEGKKGPAEGALRKDGFLQPQAMVILRLPATM